VCLMCSLLECAMLLQVLQTNTAAQNAGDDAVTHLQAQLKKAHAARQYAQGAGIYIMISYVNNYFLCTWMSVSFRKLKPRRARRVAERGYVCEYFVCVSYVCG
jgi:hypothetical protein